MNFDNVFKDDITRKFFFTDYPGNKLMVGRISLEYAMERLKKQEYYTLITYKEGEELPSEYVPLASYKSEDGTLFATVNPNILITNICNNGGIQRISRIDRPGSVNPEYLLGPGPDTITTLDLVDQEYKEYLEQNTQEKEMQL